MNPLHSGGATSPSSSQFLSFSTVPPLKRQADGRLIAPVLCPSLIDNQPQPQLQSSPRLHPQPTAQLGTASYNQLLSQQQLTAIEEEMAALQLVQEIEDEKTKASRLEWCLREILAERDVLLRQHEDEARHRRQQELAQLNHHLLRCSSVSSSPVLQASPPAAQQSLINPNARPRSTSAPPAMVSTPPAMPPVGVAQPAPLRTQPHTLRIVRQHPLQLPARVQPQPALGGHVASAHQALPLFNVGPEAPPSPQPLVKRARLAASAEPQPNQASPPVQLPPQAQAGLFQRRPSSGISACQGRVTSVDANRFASLVAHPAPPQQPQFGHVCGGALEGLPGAPGCESPVGCIGHTPPQCAQPPPGGMVMVAAGSAGQLLPTPGSSSMAPSFDWSAGSSTELTPAGSDFGESEWSLAADDFVDYDALLDNLSGL